MVVNTQCRLCFGSAGRREFKSAQRQRWWNPLLLILLCALPLVSDATQRDSLRYRLESDKPFAEVVSDLRFAIEEQNFRITDTNRVGAVIAKRQQTPFPDSIVIHFCNLEYARRMLSVAPDRLLDMPCRIVVYEYQGKVRVEARLLPQDDPRLTELAPQLNGMLRDMVRFAVE